jgi:hypothetical protein
MARSWARPSSRADGLREIIVIFTEPRRRLGALGHLIFGLVCLGCGGKNANDAARSDAGPSLTDAGVSDARTGDATVALVPGCTLPRVGSNLMHDWDVRALAVTGTLTLGGGVLPDSPGLNSRGNLVFRERTTGDVRTLVIGGAGPASFSGSLFPGSYDVSFEAAVATGLVGLPIGGKARLASALSLSADSTLTYDLVATTVAGSVTLFGGALPDSPALTTRGSMVFREPQSGDVRSFSVGATGPGAFSGSLFAGTYDVSFETVSGTLLVGLPASAETRVASAVVVTATGSPALAYDVQVAAVAGALTVNGALLPDSPTLSSRGSVIYREQHSGDLRTFNVPATGPGVYSGLLFNGSYDISFQSSPAVAGLIGLPAAATTRLATGTAITSTTSSAIVTLNYDLPIATIAGTITAGGLRLPDSATAASRGSVRFADRTTGLGTVFTIGATGDGAFGGLLFAGVYDVSFGSKRVAAGVAIAGGGPALNYDLPTVNLSGTVTANGAALPDSPGLTTRGNVVFRDRVTGVGTSFPVGATGPGTFAGTLYASSYDATFETVNSPMLVGLPVAAETRLLSDVNITSSDGASPSVYDVQIITVSGQVTLNGAALPDSPALTTRGNLVLRDKLTGDIRALPLAATGAGTFGGIAFAGSYDVALETSAATGLVGLPVAAETNLDVGCVPTDVPAGGCQSDPADLSGNWTFTFRDQVSWLRWNVSLVQTGSDLRGQFIGASGYSGQFDSGQRAGSAVTLSSMQNTATCVLRIDATVSDGCFMTGIGSCAGGVSQSAFIGVR